VEALPPGPRHIPELRLNLGTTAAGNPAGQRLAAIAPAPEGATGADAADEGTNGSDDSQVLVAHTDSTVVLPLTYRPWRREESDDEGSPAR
jgi:hypothetical protein